MRCVVIGSGVYNGQELLSCSVAFSSNVGQLEIFRNEFWCPRGQPLEPPTPTDFFLLFLLVGFEIAERQCLHRTLATTCRAQQYSQYSAAVGAQWRLKPAPLREQHTAVAVIAH